MTNHPVTMYQYHAWANQAVFNRLKELPEDLYRRQLQSVFPSLSKALSHIYSVDCGWLDIMSGMSMKESMEKNWPIEDEAEAKSLAELEAMFAMLRDRYMEFFDSKTDLEESITLDNPYAGIRETRLSQIILHVVNHGTYHRGNIAAMLRQLGHSSTMTDYAFYWYQEKPDEVRA